MSSVRPIVIDGFVLRFPRTGIVNYVFHVVDELHLRVGNEITLLLEDRNITDGEIAAFVNRPDGRIRLVERFEATSRLARLRDNSADRGLAVRLPRPREISRAIAPGEIYHATDWYHYPGRFAKRNILTYFDLTTKLFPQFHEHTNIVKERRKVQAIDGFDHIVAISDSTRRDLIEHCHVSPERISVAPLGVNPVYELGIYLKRSDVLSKYGIDSSCRYILSVSTIEPRKNIIGTLDAFKILCARGGIYDDIRLILSGPMGWRNDDLKHYMDNYRYRDRVSFVGYVDLADMPSLYHHAAAFIYLSFYEGFGIPILEAMKSSCPVVCSDTSSMPEVVGDCGEKVSPRSPEEAASALARILDDAEHADILRLGALARSREFTWRRHVDHLERVYDGL